VPARTDCVRDTPLEILGLDKLLKISMNFKPYTLGYAENGLLLMMKCNSGRRRRAVYEASPDRSLRHAESFDDRRPKDRRVWTINH